MKKSRLCSSLISLCFILLISNSVYAADVMKTTDDDDSADVEAGRVVSTQCAICHGPEGAGNGAPKSKISGMDVETFIKHINDFRNGVRKNVMMERFVERLTDEDIKNVAAYYARL